MNGWRSIIRFSAVAVASMCVSLPVWAQQSEILRNTSVDVSKYPEAATLDTTISSPDSILKLLNDSKSLPVHIETLRQAYIHYGETDTKSNELLTKLKARYLAAENDPLKFFDEGYAQLVFKKNQSGLFFLRKANDALQSPFSSLVYAIAQTDIDLDAEHAKPDEMTMRKLDVIFKIRQSLANEKATPTPGYWPTLMKFVEALKPLPAYDRIAHSDLSLDLVPYGKSNWEVNTRPPYKKPEPIAVTADASKTDSQTTTSAAVNYLSESTPVDWKSLAYSKTYDLLGDGQTESLNFFNHGDGKYRVLVTSKDNSVLADFISGKAPYIQEDLDKDGTYELVVRQYRQDPADPVEVYHWIDGKYVQDTSYRKFFE